MLIRIKLSFVVLMNITRMSSFQVRAEGFCRFEDVVQYLYLSGSPSSCRRYDMIFRGLKPLNQVNKLFLQCNNGDNVQQRLTFLHKIQPILASEKCLRAARRVDHSLTVCVFTVSEMMTKPYLCVCVCDSCNHLTAHHNE